MKHHHVREIIEKPPDKWLLNGSQLYSLSSDAETQNLFMHTKRFIKISKKCYIRTELCHLYTTHHFHS